MKRKRIGNDINIAWAIMTEDGKPFDLSNGKVSLYLKNYVRKEEVKGFSIEGNVILWTFLGKNQKNLGNHSLELVINEDAEGMITTDACDFVCLVPCSCKEGGEDDAGVKTETMNLTSVITLGGGGPVDDELNPDSKNAISNRAVTRALETLNETKQDTIEDLEEIRSGAAKGATALQSYTEKYTGTITGIKMNGASKGTSGVVDLGTVITAHQDISGKADKSSLAAVATSGSYNDLSSKPTIPAAVTESTVSGWGFTKNTGTYSKPSTGIPKSDLASAVQASLGKADTALQSYTEQYKGTVTGVKINGTTKNPSSGIVDLGTVITAHQDISGKQDKIDDLADIRSGASKGATAIQQVKTINGQSIVGSGNIEIEGGSDIDPSNFATKDELNDKQDKISDLADIRAGAALGKTALQEHQDISHLATKEEVTNLTNEMVANEEVHAAAYSDLDSRLKDIGSLISGVAVTKEEFQEGLQAITDEMVANEEVHAAAYSDLNSRLAALEAALLSINQ